MGLVKRGLSACVGRYLHDGHIDALFGKQPEADQENKAKVAGQGLELSALVAYGQGAVGADKSIVHLPKGRDKRRIRHGLAIHAKPLRDANLPMPDAPPPLRRAVRPRVWQAPGGWEGAVG